MSRSQKLCFGIFVLSELVLSLESFLAVVFSPLECLLSVIRVFPPRRAVGAQGFGFRVSGLGCRVWGLMFEGEGSGFSV